MDEVELRENFNSIKPELNKWGANVDEKLNSYVISRYASTVEMVEFKAHYRVKDDASVS